jgi:hypothetical protein
VLFRSISFSEKRNILTYFPLQPNFVYLLPYFSIIAFLDNIRHLLVPCQTRVLFPRASVLLRLSIAAQSSVP